MEPWGTPALLDILVKTFDPEPLEVVYYWEKKGLGEEQELVKTSEEPYSQQDSDHLNPVYKADQMKNVTSSVKNVIDNLVIWWIKSQCLILNLMSLMEIYWVFIILWHF